MSNQPFTVIAYITRTLKSNVERASDIRTKLAADIAKGDGDALYAISWMQGRVEALHLGNYSQAILDLIAKSEDWKESDTLATIRGFINGEVSRWRPERSTSAYSNVTNDEKLLALQSLAERLNGAW